MGDSRIHYIGLKLEMLNSLLECLKFKMLHTLLERQNLHKMFMVSLLETFNSTRRTTLHTCATVKWVILGIETFLKPVYR